MDYEVVHTKLLDKKSLNYHAAHRGCELYMCDCMRSFRLKGRERTTAPWGFAFKARNNKTSWFFNNFN